ncbi:MAG TPA: hypothetical protein VM370_10655 [Candidatus Thermoplasmatota archaeon]|nr:hypothetical protein [Candidatus Thermoplasmatota archaeon]
MMTARFEKKEFRKIMLYLDVLVLGIFAVSLVVLVRDSYVAGFWEQRDATNYSMTFWAMMRDAVFVVGALSWIFYRYCKTQASQFSDPWE